MPAEQGYAIAKSVITWLGGGLIITTAVVGTAWAMFRAWSDKWLEARFNERLEAFKHAGALEIARVQFSIDAKMDRAVKLHEKEFETLSVAWDMLSTMMGSAAQVVAHLRSYAPVGSMNVDELEVLLAQSNFAEHEQNSIRNAQRNGRDNFYQKLVDREQLSTAFKDRATFHNYIIQRGIFVQPPLRAKLMDLSVLISDALITHGQISQDDYPPPRPYTENGAKVHTQGKALMDEINQAISDRLWDARSLELG